MRKRLIALTFLAGGVVFGQVSIGIRIGEPPPPRVVSVLPARPGPEFILGEGYWYPAGGHYRWHQGYWTRPPYDRAHWIGPRHDSERSYEGYWEDDRGRSDHPHKIHKH